MNNAELAALSLKLEALTPDERIKYFHENHKLIQVFPTTYIEKHFSCVFDWYLNFVNQMKTNIQQLARSEQNILPLLISELMSTAEHFSLDWKEYRKIIVSDIEAEAGARRAVFVGMGKYALNSKESYIEGTTK